MNLKIFDTIRQRVGAFWWHSGLMFIVSRIGDAGQLVIGAFLVPMYVPAEELGAVLPLLNIGAFLSVPMTAAAMTAGRFVTSFRVSENPGRIRAVLRDLTRVAGAVSIAGIIVVLACRPLLAERLFFEGWAVPVLVAGLLAASCWQPVVDCVLLGLGRYYRITSAGLMASIARIVLACALLPLWGLKGFLGMNLAATAIVWIYLLGGIRSYFSSSIPAVSNRAMARDAWRFFVPMLAFTGALAFQHLIEPLIIRHRLPLDQSAAYYIASRFGMIPSYLAGAFSVFLFPMAAEQHDRGETPQGLKVQVLGGVLVSGLLVSVLLAVFGHGLLGMFPAWRPYQPYSWLLWQTAVIAIGSSLISLYCMHEAACHRFKFLRIVLPVTAIETSGLYCLMGWSFFEGILPGHIWQQVNSIITPDISIVTAIMILARFIMIAGILLVNTRLFSPGKGDTAQ